MKRPPFSTWTLVFSFVLGIASQGVADDEPAKVDKAKASAIRSLSNRVSSGTKADAKETEVEAPAATHKQTSIIEIGQRDQPVRLTTFTLGRNGEILACMSAGAARGSQNSDESGVKGYLQVYSPEGKLTRESGLEYPPTAVAAMPDGSVIVAGSGKLSRISAEGQVLVTIDSPHVGDLESLADRLKDEAKEQMKAATKRYTDMVGGVKERLAAIEAIPEDELTARDKAMLKSLPRQMEMYEENAKRMEESYARIYSPEALLSRKLGITSLAATEKDIFVTAYSIKGRGYEVWRMNHELSAPKQILTGLGGCCGQCDVQAAGDNIVIGENTKFKVALVDRDGKRLSSFGKRDRSSVDGFGSCCNPMNVTCCSNGDIITSESSVGNIKRFSASGEYLGLVGKASISGGCKHVAVSFDEKRNRFYTMNIDKGHICVLVPLSEAPETTEEEQISQSAMEAHGASLVGTWERASGSSVVSASSIEPNNYEFRTDGALKMDGRWASYKNTWEPVSHADDSIRLKHLRDGIHYYDLIVEFGKNDTATISQVRAGSTSSRARSTSYRRVSCGEDCPEKTSSESKQNDVDTETATVTDADSE